jgi:V/A-type H+-transporting ATPase subunit E
LTEKTGLSAIAHEVFDDVAKEAEVLILKAHEEAKASLQSAKREADRNYQNAVDAAKSRSEAEAKRIASVTDMETRNQLLAAKEELVNDAFRRAQEQIDAFVKTDRYHPYLLDSIRQASERMSIKNLTVKVNAADRAWLAQNSQKLSVGKQGVVFELSDETISCIGGYIIQTKDGSVSYDGTIDNRLSELRPSLRTEAAKILFREEEH